jgi:anti-sigma regulatory factor (Ser/Thr protein kinase)
MNDQAVARRSPPPLDPFAGAVGPLTVRVEPFAFGPEDLGAVRRLVFKWALGIGLGSDRSEHLVLAVNELTSNSVRHGGGAGTVRMWSEEGTLLVEVRDRGHISGPLVGRTPPAPGQPNGRGLWLADELSDLLEIRSGPTGSVVRVHMRLA